MLTKIAPRNQAPNIVAIGPYVTARLIGKNPHQHFLNLARDLQHQMMLLMINKHGALAARVRAAAETAQKLSRTRKFDPNQLRAFAAELRLLSDESAELVARLEAEIAAQGTGPITF
jgi:hypothetical protein